MTLCAVQAITIDGRDLFARLKRMTMDKYVAKSLLSLGKSFDDIIVKMFAEVEQIADENLKSRFKKAIGDLMGSVARDVIFPIENLYPDLRTKE
jgi:hypothetical protein